MSRISARTLECRGRFFEKRLKQTAFILATIGMIMFLSFLFSIQAKGNENVEVVDRSYYHELEMTYLDVIDAQLTRCGYLNCGITLNSIIDLNGNRTYYVQVHHQRIDNMDDSGKLEIIELLEQIAFPVEQCSVSFEFV